MVAPYPKGFGSYKYCLFFFWAGWGGGCCAVVFFWWPLKIIIFNSVVRYIKFHLYLWCEALCLLAG